LPAAATRAAPCSKAAAKDTTTTGIDFPIVRGKKIPMTMYEAESLLKILGSPPGR